MSVEPDRTLRYVVVGGMDVASGDAYDALEERLARRQDPIRSDYLYGTIVQGMAREAAETGDIQLRDVTATDAWIGDLERMAEASYGISGGLTVHDPERPGRPVLGVASDIVPERKRTRSCIYVSRIGDDGITRLG